MTRLHEILAVEGDKNTVVHKLLEEAKHYFKSKADAFTGSVKTKRHFDEADQKLDTEEVKRITTTVSAKLGYLAGPLSDLLDIKASKEATNQLARADILIDESESKLSAVIAKDVPVTMLLELEKRLAEFRTVLDEIPTLRPGRDWRSDINQANVYVAADDEITFATRKVTKPVVLSPATDRHPAQVEKVSEDIPVAKITTRSESGMITPLAKAQMLARLEKLQEAVKRARQRANSAEVTRLRVGKDILRYIYGDVVEI